MEGGRGVENQSTIKKGAVCLSELRFQIQNKKGVRTREGLQMRRIARCEMKAAESLLSADSDVTRKQPTHPQMKSRG